MTMATVHRNEAGQLVMNDPEAMAVITAVAKYKCRNTAEEQRERIQHFNRRVNERGLLPDYAVIVVINVDDANGELLADLLMPGHDWQAIRNRGEVPFARGLAEKEGIQIALGIFDEEAREKLMTMHGVAVVVVDHGVAEIFAVEDFCE